MLVIYESHCQLKSWLESGQQIATSWTGTRLSCAWDQLSFTMADKYVAVQAISLAGSAVATLLLPHKLNFGLK